MLAAEAGVLLDADVVDAFVRSYSPRRSIASMPLSTAVSARLASALQLLPSGLLGGASLAGVLPAIGAAGCRRGTRRPLRADGRGARLRPGGVAGGLPRGPRRPWRLRRHGAAEGANRSARCSLPRSKPQARPRDDLAGRRHAGGVRSGNGRRLQLSYRPRHPVEPGRPDPGTRSVRAACRAQPAAGRRAARELAAGQSAAGHDAFGGHPARQRRAGLRPGRDGAERDRSGAGDARRDGARRARRQLTATGAARRRARTTPRLALPLHARRRAARARLLASAQPPMWSAARHAAPRRLGGKPARRVLGATLSGGDPGRLLGVTGRAAGRSGVPLGAVGGAVDAPDATVGQPEGQPLLTAPNESEEAVRRRPRCESSSRAHTAATTAAGTVARHEQPPDM